MGISSKELVKKHVAGRNPWPKLEGSRIRLPPYLHQSTTDEEALLIHPGYYYTQNPINWIKYHSLFYNGLLDVEITPTRFIDISVITEMGIAEPVKELLKQMDLGTLPFVTYPLYPDLVRQFLATVQVVYSGPNAEDSYLFYFCEGRRYEISMTNFCHLYGFRADLQQGTFNQEAIAEVYPFWRYIAQNDAVSILSMRSHLRNPALRMIALILEHTLNASDDPYRECNELVYLILSGLKRFAPITFLEIGFAPTLTWDLPNLGVIFAEFLATKRFRALGPHRIGRTESVGSLITPIFRFHEINLNSTSVDSRILYLDRAYLDQLNIYRQGVYQFRDLGGLVSYCRLPKPTCATTFESIFFAPKEYLRCRQDGSPIITQADQHEFEQVKDLKEEKEYDIGSWGDPAN